MVNKFKDIDWSPDATERKKFARTLMIGMPCMGIGLSIILRLASGQWNFQAPGLVVGIGLLVAAICWLLPALALPVYRVWFFLVCIIDTVVTTVVLTLLFYVVMLAAGLLYQVFKRSAFRKRPEPSSATYWQDVPATQDMARYYRQY